LEANRLKLTIIFNRHCWKYWTWTKTGFSEWRM